MAKYSGLAVAAACASCLVTAPVAAAAPAAAHARHLATAAAPASNVVHCEHYALANPRDSLDVVTRTYGMDGTEELQLLNPGWDLTHGTPQEGTPLCVVGTTKAPKDTRSRRAINVQVAEGYEGKWQQGGEIRVGKVPSSTNTYTTTPGVDSCYRIATNATPYLGTAALLAMNPQLNCAELATQPATVKLPPGTTVGDQPTPLPEDQDAILGPWGDWTECGANGRQARYRSTYQQQRGSGAAWPGPDVETRPCVVPASTAAAGGGGGRLRRILAGEGGGGDARRLLAPEECPAGYDGCSVPDGLVYYRLFSAPCNAHDICYACGARAGWGFATKEWCDGHLRAQMHAQCERYWSGALQVFDRAYCTATADACVMDVALASTMGLENFNSALLDGGCEWLPDSPELNNALGAGFDPEAAGCPCEGRSCE